MKVLLMVLALSSLGFAITDCEVCGSLFPTDCTIAMVEQVAKTTEIEWKCLDSIGLRGHTKDVNATPIHTAAMMNYSLKGYSDNGNVVIEFPKNIAAWNITCINDDNCYWWVRFSVSPFTSSSAKMKVYTAFSMQKLTSLIDDSTSLTYKSVSVSITESPSLTTTKTAYGYDITANFASKNETSFIVRGTLGRVDVCVLLCLNPADNFVITNTLTGAANVQINAKFTNFAMRWGDAPGNSCTITAECILQGQDLAGGVHAIPLTDYSKNLDGNGTNIYKKNPVKDTTYDFNSVQCHQVGASSTRAYLNGQFSAQPAYSCINSNPVCTINIPADMQTVADNNVTVKCTCTDYQYTWGGNITFWTNQTTPMSLANTSVCACSGSTTCTCTRDLNFTTVPDGVYNISCNGTGNYKEVGLKNITVIISRNTAPYTFNLNITPLGLNTFQNAFCAYTLMDGEQSSLNVSIRFFIDDHVNPAYEYVAGQAYMVAYNNTANISTTSVPPGATLPGWSVRCDVNSSDGITTSGWIIGPYTTYTPPPGGGGEGGGGGGGYTPPPPEDIEEGIEETGGQVSGELFGFDMSQITGLPWVIIIPLAIGGFFILLDDDDDEDEKGDKHGARY